MMKRTTLLALLTAATLFGCSSGDDLFVNNSANEGVLPNETLYSNVPIRFAPVNMTAFVEEIGDTRGMSDDSITIDNVGLFCLAKRSITQGVADNKYPSWSGKASAKVNLLSVWKKNIPVSIRFGNDKKGDIIWDNPMNDDYYPYYPESEWFAYGFVAYHPRTEYIAYTQTSIKAYMKIDGTQNVFLGTAIRPKTYTGDQNIDTLGFSKPYYRAISDHDDGVEEYINPYFTFVPLTSALNFYFWMKSEPVMNLHVEKVEFDGFPCVMQLGLATMLRTGNRTPYNMKSSIAKNPFVLNDSLLNDITINNVKLSELSDDFSSAFGHYEVRELDGSSIGGQRNTDGSYKYNLTTTKQQVGAPLYIPPVYATHSRSELKIYVTLADNAGNKYRSTKAVKVKAPTSGWGKGKSYDIKIWLDGPVNTATDASLVDWQAEVEMPVDATGTQWETVN